LSRRAADSFQNRIKADAMVFQAQIGPVQTEGQSEELGDIKGGQAEAVMMLSFQHQLAPVELGKARGAGHGHSLDLVLFHVPEFFPGDLIGGLGVYIGPQG